MTIAPWNALVPTGEIQVQAGVQLNNGPIRDQIKTFDQAHDTRYLRIDVLSVQPLGGPYGSDIYYATVCEVAVGVRPIPEPTSAALLVAGGLIAAWYPAFTRRCIRGS